LFNRLFLKINIFNVIVLLGAFQGFILAGVFLFSKKLKRQSNFFLALLLLSFSMVNTANCLWDMGFSREQALLQHLPLNWTLLIPFALYYFVQSLINPFYELSGKEYLLLIPFAIQIIQKLLQLVLFLSNPVLLQSWQPFFKALIQLLEVTAIIYCVVVFFISIKKINQFQQQLQNQFANIERRSLFWIKNILNKVAFLLALWIVPYVVAAINKTDVNGYMYPLWIGMTVVVYWLAWSMFSRRDLFEYTPPEILQPAELSPPTVTDIKKNKPVSEKWEPHYQALTRLMEEEKLYLDFDISMTSLAQKMQLSNGYLSQIINQKEGLNFYDYINRYRVEEVKKRLADPKYSHLSLYGLALDCGFKSKSTFNGVFKKMTGLTPSEYRKPRD
jgi:AraC-like DNA-binding protein